MLGVPSISLGGFGEDAEVATCNWDAGEIEDSLNRVLSEKPALDSLLAKYVHEPDGGATDRATERILEICNRSTGLALQSK